MILPEGSAFGAVESATFRFGRTMRVPDVIEWLSTDSAFITAPPADQAAARERWQEILLSRARREPDGVGPVLDLPLRSWCGRAGRR